MNRPAETIRTALLAGILMLAAAAFAAEPHLLPTQTTAASRADTRPAGVRPRDLVTTIGPIIERHVVPGMAAAIVTSQGLEAIGVAGVRQAGSPEKITVDDLFHIGSCTKSMTATMIAALVDEGLLSWSSTVGEVFADLDGHTDPAWKPVTLEQLLTHRSGAPSDLNTDGLWARLWNHQGTPIEQRMTLVEGVIARPPVSTPGTSYLYSNAGVAIAGAMAEKVTGRAWEDLMREHLFQPLGMNSAGFGAPGAVGNDTAVDQPRGHRPAGTSVAPGPGSDNPAAIGPAGTVHCTIGDWAKYISLHLQAERGECNLLRPESFLKLHTPYPSADTQKYAMGWSVAARDWARKAGSDGRVLTHNGSNTMWFCVSWLAPAPGQDFAVLVMCNQGGDNAAKACDEAAYALIQDHLAHAEGRRAIQPQSRPIGVTGTAPSR